ncbi:GmrSD restriction endonuclease domain-containing protein [Bacillus paramycoides]|uniref:GmrSD restriction endonuclease domain-containing protein n=1 Tax=Bacillus paramycoides TaxID=2026194 RepID=UPI003D044ADD
MSINENLIKAASFNPTKKTYQIAVSKMCEEIASSQIVLPLYQRDVSWTLQKCVDLLNYQLLGKAPVAPISINQINNTERAVEQVSLIDREPIDGPLTGKLSITDGQQRLTTNYKAYINSNEFRNVVLDLVAGEFRIVDGKINKNLIPVGALLNQDISEFFAQTELQKPKVTNLLLQIRNKIRDYNYTINLAEDLTEDEQIEWFEVLNNAGSRVTRIQMKISKLKALGIDIYVQYTNVFRDKIEESGMNVFKLKATEVSVPIAALNTAYEIVTGKPHSLNFTPIPSDTRESQIFNLPNHELLKCLELTLNSLDNAINFITINGLSIPKRVDYLTYLTGFFSWNHNNELSSDRKDKLIQWYNTVNFSNKSNGERRNIFDSLLKI